jgi:hypothetical protein
MLIMIITKPVEEGNAMWTYVLFGSAGCLRLLKSTSNLTAKKIFEGFVAGDAPPAAS